MQRVRFYYLIKLQYLGFRYHGWQKQPDVNTVERMVERTISYVLDRKKFKLIAAGRTDAKVSVNQTYVELFVDNEPLSLEEFFPLLNKNLPPDIRALEVTETTKDFNIINHPKQKEYLYFFAYKEKFHPFCAPFMVYMRDDLDIELMKKGAKLFEGTHDFWSYAFKPKPETITQGTIDFCELADNDIYTANFFPEKSYVLRIKGKGFKRYQIRLMMGTLFDLGKGLIDLDFIKKTLQAEHKIKLEHIAQPSGLILNEVKLD
ncbi:tRNA pseudouridine38-40 synthase [Mesonia phycicola]|uniref:tRNA pseudouridine synthase A n=1 Tax=Mesonia phycicola TaxID=579105 RepID=A0A1M6DM95_9FLAO|nr:tRNA pseudouridine(38-40) synthase TruA [Mesonia phycicola]SHI74437.1 tRNA pseudouridine38-40 synthase [Mesonia phycicola]